MSDTSNATENAAPASLLAGEEGAPAEAPTTDSTAVTDTDAAKTGDEGEAPAPGEAEAPEGEAKGEGESGEDAPEFELSIPEGFEVDEAALADLKTLAKEAGLKPEQAQKLVDMHVGVQKALVERADAAIAEHAKAMQAAVKADKEIGGAAFESSLKVAKATLSRFGTPELVAAVNESGLGNHPELIRLLVRVGKATSEDSSAGKHSGSPTAASKEEALLRSLYPDLS